MPTLLLPLLVSAALTGCAQEEERTVTLGGEVTYADYTEGYVDMGIYESESSWFAPWGSVKTESPGDWVKSVWLMGVGSWSTEATFQWATEAPDIEIIAWLVPDSDAEVVDCLAGATVSLPLEDDEDIVIPLVAGECPVRR